MRYIIFSRVSTSDQRVANQIKECRLYLKDKITPKDEIFEFEEPETSSRIPMEERETLQEMLSFLRRGDTLIVYKLDRLARKGSELVGIYTDLKERGIKIYSIQEPTADEEYVHIIAFVAMKERANIRARTISGLNRKKADMEKVGSTWYGYKTDSTKLQLSSERARSYKKPYLLIPDEEEQANLETMKRLKDQGLTYGEITKEMARLNCRNRRGNHFQKTSIFRILKREEMKELKAV